MAPALVQSASMKPIAIFIMELTMMDKSEFEFKIQKTQFDGSDGWMDGWMGFGGRMNWTYALLYSC
jgi:hypothetical protein